MSTLHVMRDIGTLTSKEGTNEKRTKLRKEAADKMMKSNIHHVDVSKCAQ